MKDATLTEYGQAIDPNRMVAPPDVATFELEPEHPGLGDAAYIARRKYLFDLTRKHRLEHLGPPLIDYTVEETTGQVVEGRKTDPVKFEEYWIFTRSVGNNPWQLSDINPATYKPVFRF